MSFRPVFVLGLARSGTNLLARMLDRHPRIAVALDPFMPLFRALRNAAVRSLAPAPVQARFRPDSPFQDYYFDADGPALLDALLGGDARLAIQEDEVVRLRRGCAERAALESRELGGRMGELVGRDHAALLESGLRIVATMRPGAAWVGCKEVWIYDFVPMLARAFPQARFYAIERDPRAIVASLAAMAKDDPTQSAHAPSYVRHWRKSVALARRYEADPSLSQRFRSICYERMVIEPEAEARRVCDELGVSFTPGMLDLSADGWRGNSSYTDVGTGVYSASSERWRTELPEDSLRTVDFLCGPEMSLTGYRPTGEEAFGSEVLRDLEHASRQPGSWRSDSGDTLVDLGGELVRHALLETRDNSDTRLVRRCFLFTETFEAIMRARSRDRSARDEAGSR